MADELGLPDPSTVPGQEKTIDSTFRSGSLTAISVLVGFSLSFLTRWAASPGPWRAGDLFALSAIVLGIAFQIAALASLLAIHSLLLRNYNRAVKVFLAGLALVATGVGIAITEGVADYGQQLLGG